MGILSGLSSLGLDKLEGAELYSKEEKQAKQQAEVQVKTTKIVDEADFLLDKTFECYVCHNTFKERKVKTGKARLVSQDKDLRPIYNGIDPGKYDIISCPHCGYSAIEKYFPNIAAPQAKLIKENISNKFKKFERGSIISYDEAIERYKLTLANCIVKKGRDSEKAYVCLKMAWVIRGYIESLDFTLDNQEKAKELKMDEEELLHNALEGFLSARETERFPIAGMDEVSFDYLLSVLCLNENKLDEAGRFVMNVIQSRVASNRLKNKALDLKAEIIEKRK